MQLGQIRVFAARQPEVEKTKEFSESDIPAVAMHEPTSFPGNGQRRQ